MRGFRGSLDMNIGSIPTFCRYGHIVKLGTNLRDQDVR